ncbi:amidohydrolase family protein [Limibacillus sp. MBR-115]|jgi:predicted TIM-barrel fold metal-dependent hydrolase|uniref:amidohydrolase family protein n=1 Tax=Limibacillus sp. MBR-115 TaxID=3156465 RepID=UPI003394F865
MKNSEDVISAIVDCHLHIIEPENYPISKEAGYTPSPHETGNRENILGIFSNCNVSSALLVQPSCYGYHNDLLVEIMQEYPGKFKGISVIDHAASDHCLGRLVDAGVIGARFNLVSSNGRDRDLEAIKNGRILDRLKELGWWVQVFGSDEQWSLITPHLMRKQIPTIVDHFGIQRVAPGTAQPGFQSILMMGREGLSVVKLSAAFRLLPAAHMDSELEPFIEQLVSSFGLSHCVWGSDWPFLGVDERPAYTDALNRMNSWFSIDDQEFIFSRNPRKIFGFSG